MNTLGKLLVIVNLLFALATGAFLAVDYAARTDWKKVADARTEELAVMKANNAAMVGTNANLVAEVKKTRSDFNEFMVTNQSRLGQERLEIERQKKELVKAKDDAEFGHPQPGKGREANRPALRRGRGPVRNGQGSRKRRSPRRIVAGEPVPAAKHPVSVREE